MKTIIYGVRRAFVVLAALVIAPTLFAQTPSLTAFELGDHAAPSIDGVLDEQVWDAAPRISEFHQTRPDDHGQPSENTEVQLVISEEFIYLAFRAYDSEAKKISGKGLVQGQTFFSDDRMNVSFDTFNDQRNSYFFQVNPNGIRREALVGSNYFIDDWDTVWFADAKVYDWGWVGEMAIPLKSIAFDPNTSRWGINFGRNLPSRGESLSWSSIDRQDGPSAFGTVDNMEGFSQGLGLELNPSVAVGYQDSLQNDSDTSFEPSLTTFYNITPFLTAGATINTDFSGTEADERQINLGRFSLFFPEKRDFFLRDASIFEFGGLESNARPFFSRRIGLSSQGEPLDLEAGLKLTGRAGDWNIGALAIQQDTVAQNADDKLFVGRVTKNVFNESEVGFITTVGDPNSDSNNTLRGADYTYRNSELFGDQRFSSNVWFQESDTLGFNDNQRAYGVSLNYPNYKYDGFIDLRRIEENFNPAIGFVNRAGVDQVDSRLRRRFSLDGGRFEWIGARAQYFRSDRIGGGVQTERAQLNFIEGLSRTNDFFTLFYVDQTEGLDDSFTLPGGIRVDAGLYNFKRFGVFFETGTQRALSGEFLYARGDFFDGKRELIEQEIQWRPSKHFFGGLSYERNKIELPTGSFTSKLYSLRANIAFNSKWAWLNLVQGDNVGDTVSLNSRVRYQPRADREYFLVFNQTRDNVTDEELDTSLVFKASFNFQL